MKYALFIVGTLMMTIAYGQKKAEISFRVDGVCGMCEARIEKALDVPGIIFADWDLETKKLTVAYKTKKISELEIHEAIARAGHDTDQVKAPDEVYANIHGCCKYRDGAKCSGEDGHEGEHDHDHLDPRLTP